MGFIRKALTCYVFGYLLEVVVRNSKLLRGKLRCWNGEVYNYVNFRIEQVALDGIIKNYLREASLQTERSDDEGTKYCTMAEG